MLLPPTLRQMAAALLLLVPWPSLAQTPVAPAPVFANVPQENIAPDSTDFKLFDPAFYNNQLFLLGEAHGVQRPQALDFALLKHLNQRAGVRTYVAEVDVSKAYYLN